MVDKGSKPRRRRGRNKSSSNPHHETSSFSSKQPSSSSLSPSTTPGNNATALNGFKAHKSLLIHLTEETPTWYECGRHTSGRDDTIYSHPSPTTSNNNSVQEYRSLADSIFQTEMQLFSASSSSGQDEKWVESTMKRGTLKDRVAAMSVVVSQNPVHKLYALDGLLQLAGCSSQSKQTNSRVAQMAADALLDLFLNTMLPNNRKLYGLDQRPFHLYNNNTSTASDNNSNNNNNKTLSPRILLLWRYEEMVKQKYQLFIRHYLEYTLNHHSGTTGASSSGNTSSSHNGGGGGGSSSNVEMTKVFALRTCSSLLQQAPEQEAYLLSILVNKLGDPMKKIAAAAGHELRQILKHHPLMKLVIAREVQQLSYRPQLSPRALYNCIIFLNQLQLEKEEDDKKDNGNDDDDDDDGNDSDENQQDKKNHKTNQQVKKSTSLPASLINTYFRLFEVAVQQHKNSKNKNGNHHTTNNNDNAMKSRLLSAILTGVNRAHPYLPKKDQQMEQHIDTLYRIVHTSSPATCTQALMLLFHLAVGSETQNRSNHNKNKDSGANDKVSKARQDRFYRALYSTLGGGSGGTTSLVSSGKHLTLYFNLLYKAMKYDKDQVRVIALAKRLLCSTLNCGSAPVLAGSIFLVNEVMKYHPSLKSALEESSRGTDDNDDDDNKMVMLDPSKREPHGALVRFIDGTTNTKSTSNPPTSVPLWEVSLVSHHYHPSVSKFANTMGGTISYGGDPLKDFGLVPFLDKFAYRNPKKNANAGGGDDNTTTSNRRGESIAERRFASSMAQTKQGRMTVNDPKKQKWDESEEFFQTFFAEQARRDQIKGIVRHKSQYGDDEDEKAAFEEADGTMEAADKIDFDTQFDDTDSEEEEFVTKLAENLMASSAGARGGKAGDQAHYDDEDPDMEDWSDFDEDDDKAAAENDDDEADMDAVLLQGEEGDSDVDPDNNDDDDDDDDFMDAAQDDSDSEDGGDMGNVEDADSDDDDEDYLALMGNDDDEEDEDGNEQQPTKKNKKHDFSEAFADASEYEELINKSWGERTTEDDEDDHQEEEDGIEHTPPQLQKKQKKKHKKRRKQ